MPIQTKPPVLLPSAQKKSPWPTVIDYGVFILVAVASALIALFYLTQDQKLVMNKPADKLQDVLKQ